MADRSAQVATGMFGFEDLMKDYYGYKPGDDDEAGRASKRAFQENMIQTAFDSQLAMQNAAMAQEFELDATKQMANLELRNQTQLQEDTFKYGMKKMEQEYNYQSKFAVDEAKRNLQAMTHGGQIQQNQTKLEGIENRMTLDKQGEIDLRNIAATGDETRKTLGEQATQNIREKLEGDRVLQSDALKSAEEQIRISGDQAVRQIETQGNVDLKNISGQSAANIQEKLQADREIQRDALASTERITDKTGAQALAQIGASGNEAVRQIGAQAAADQGTTRVAGDETRKTVGAQADADVRTIGATGDQNVRSIGAQSDADVRSIGAKGDVDKALQGMQGIQALEQIGATGTENRLTMDKQDDLDTKKENRAEARSRALARR